MEDSYSVALKITCECGGVFNISPQKFAMCEKCKKVIKFDFKFSIVDIGPVFHGAEKIVISSMLAPKITKYKEG